MTVPDFELLMDMDKDRSNQPLCLPNASVLRNRLVKVVMGEALGTHDSRSTLSLMQLYRLWAALGQGLIVMGNAMIHRRVQGTLGNAVIADESDLPAPWPSAQTATEQVAALWIQLNDPGKQSTKGLNTCTQTNSCTLAVPFREDMAAFFETPREAATIIAKSVCRTRRSTALSQLRERKCRVRSR